MITVSKKTFSNWENHKDFDVDVDDEGNIARVRCKVCTSHINVIRQEAKRKGLRGNVLDGVLNYVDGADGAHKSNIMRHTWSGGRHTWSGGLHDWAKTKFRTEGANSSLAAPVERVEREKTQRSIEEATLKNPVVSENYKRLFVTAFHVAMTEKPLTDFPDLIYLQKRNGLKFFEGKTHEKACAAFISELAKVLRNDLKQILESVSFFFDINGWFSATKHRS